MLNENILRLFQKGLLKEMAGFPSVNFLSVIIITEFVYVYIAISIKPEAVNIE